MPQAIPLVVAIGASAAGAAAAAAGTATILGLTAATWGIIGVGLTVVGTLAGVLLAPTVPKPQMADGSQSIKQSVPPRVRVYGRYRVAGAYVFYDTNDSGDLVVLLCHAAHQVSSFQVHWLNDQIVTLDGSGNVHGGVYDDYDPILPVRVVNYLGTPTQVIDGMLTEWGPDNKCHGLACTKIKYGDLKADLQQKVFPQGAPGYRATLNGALVFDPRDPAQVYTNEATYLWTDNAAIILLDFLTRLEAGIPVGFGIPIDRINLDSFKTAADVCNELVTLKAGGTEKRWRACGAYELTEEKKSVLSDLLDACGGRLIQAPDGRIGLIAGEPNPVANVTITEDQLISWDFSTGPAAIERINEVRATYVSEDQGWQEVEAGIQTDQAAVDRNGTESSSLKLRFVPTDGQAQRIARYSLLRGSPTRSGKLTGTLALLDAWGERWIRLISDELDINQIFEVTSMQIDRDSMTVQMEITSYDGWWDWNAAEDEQDAAEVPTLPDHSNPVLAPPTGVTVTQTFLDLDSQNRVGAAVTSWTPPTSASVVADGRWRQGTGVWQKVSVDPDAVSFQIAPLQDGLSYQTSVRFRGPRGTVSVWVDSAPFIALANPVPPAPPIGLTAVAAGGSVTLNVAAPNDPHFSALRFWRGTSAVFSAATMIAGPFFGAPGVMAIYVDTPPIPGNLWYFATAENGSGVISTPAVAGPVGIAPAVPVINSPSATIGNANPVVSGTAYAGSTVTVFVDGVLNQTTTATGGAWSVTLNGLALGARSITAKADVGGNVSAASGAITLTRVWYDPDCSIEIDYKGLRYRLNGVDTNAAVSGWAGLFGTISIPDQIFDRGDGVFRRTGANVMPIGLNGLQAEVTRTNRNTNFNAAPVTGVTTNLTKGGAAAATLSTFADTANLTSGIFADASMTAILSTGNAFVLDNSAGVTDAWVDFGGVVAGLTAHSFQVCVRGDGGTLECATSAVAIATFATSSAYQRVIRNSFTPGNVADVVRLRVAPGKLVAFVMNQLENAADVSGPIVVAGAAATRAAPNVLRVLGTEWNATEGYIGVRGFQNPAATGNGVAYMVQVDSSHRHFVQYLLPTTVRALTQNVTNVGGPLDKTPLTLSTLSAAVYGYKSADYAMSVNGTAVLTGGAGAPPTGTFTLIAMNSTNALRGTIERFKAGKVKPANAAIVQLAGWVIT